MPKALKLSAVAWAGPVVAWGLRWGWVAAVTVLLAAGCATVSPQGSPAGVHAITGAVMDRDLGTALLVAFYSETVCRDESSQSGP